MPSASDGRSAVGPLLVGDIVDTLLPGVKAIVGVTLGVGVSRLDDGFWVGEKI